MDTTAQVVSSRVSRMRDSDSARTPLQKRLEIVEPIIWIGLAMHGIIVLLYVGGTAWQGVVVGAVGVLGGIGLFWEVTSDRERALYALGLVASAYALMAGSGGVGSPFLLWLFVIVVFYPFFFERYRAFVIPGVVLLAFVLVAPIDLGGVSALMAGMRGALLLFLGGGMGFIGTEIHDAYAEVEHVAEQSAKAEATLRESREWLEMALESAQMGTWSWNIQGNEVIWSEQVASVVGLSRDEFEGTFEAYRELVHPGDQDRWLAQIQAALKEGTYETEHRVVRPDGEILWVEVKGQVYYDEDGQPVKMMGTVMDVTGRKRAAEALEQHTERLQHYNRILRELTQRMRDAWGDLDAMLRTITEAGAEALRVERVNVWRFDDEHAQITCIEQYQRSDDEHTGGAVLQRKDYPTYFDALTDARIIAAHNAWDDARTQEFAADYFPQHGIGALLDAPVRVGGEVAGVLCFEQVGAPREWTPEEQIFAGSVADFVSMALEDARRQEAEEALQHEEELLQKIFDTIPVMITIYDPSIDNVRVNEEFERVVGWSTEDAQEIDLMEACYPDPEYRREVTAFMQSLQPEWRDLRMTTRSGEVIETSWTNVRLTDDTQVGIGIDITERKEAERELQESKEFAERLIEAMQDGLSVLNADTTQIQVNEALCQMTGYSREELVGVQSPYPYWPPEEYEPIERAFEKTLNGEFEDFELIFKRKNGERFPVIVSPAHLTDEEGEVVNVVSTVKDITERKQVEEALREEISFRETLVQQAAEGICVCHEIEEAPYLEFTIWNERMTEITGYAKSEINRLGWYQTMYPDEEDRTRAVERMERMRRGDDLMGEEWTIARADGEKRVVSISTSVVEGDETHVLAVMHDVTERNRIMRENERFNAELQVLLKVSQHIIEHLDVDVVNERIVEGIIKTIPHAEAASLWMRREENQMVPVAWVNYEDAVMSDLSRPDDSSLLGATLQRTAPLIVDDTSTSDRFERWGIDSVDRIRSVLAVPVVIEDEPIGVLAADNFSQTAAFNERDGRLLRSLAAQAGVAIQNAELVEDLQQVSRRLLKAQEEERRRIAQELHDEVGGVLTSLQMCIDTAEHHLPAEPASEAPPIAREELKEAKQLIEDLTSQVRQLSLNLRPSALDDLGLAAALQELVGRKEKHTGVQVQLYSEIEPEQRFPEAVETAIYRVVQEALTNAIRHAGVDSVQVMVNVLSDRLRIHVIDEGQGFKPETLRTRDTMGLSGMRERIELLGGTFEVSSTPEEGTRVSATIPLD